METGRFRKRLRAARICAEPARLDRQTKKIRNRLIAIYIVVRPFG